TPATSSNCWPKTPSASPPTPRPPSREVSCTCAPSSISSPSAARRRRPPTDRRASGTRCDTMAEEFPSDLPLWPQFQDAARRRRCNPARLLTDYMRECLEIWDDQQLDDEIRRQAQASGYREEDAVELVRRCREERSPGAAS